MFFSEYRMAASVAGALLALAVSIFSYWMYYIAQEYTLGLSDLVAVVCLSLSLSIATAMSVTICFLRYCHRDENRPGLVLGGSVTGLFLLAVGVTINMLYFQGNLGVAWALVWVISGRAFAT